MVKKILVYLIIAVVVYGLAAYTMFYKNMRVQNKNMYGNTQNFNYDLAETEDKSEDIENVDLSENENESMIIKLSQNGFSPSTLTIKAGNTVFWNNESESVGSVYSADHPNHNEYAPLNLGEFDQNESLYFMFNEPGTYHYHNHLNPQEIGTIIVE